MKFVLGALILAFVSNTVQTESLQDISPLVNIIILFFLITIILRLRLFHAFIMVAIGYVVQAFVQWVLYSTLIHYGVFKEIEPYTRNGYSVQGMTFMAICLISAFIYYTKGGFSYIQSHSRFYKDSFRGNKLFVVFMAIGLIILIGVNVVYIASYEIPSDLLTAMVAILVVLIILIYFSIRKDG
ncbi:hypothetical protein [Cohnella zeiphila]|uniref:Uncharacterized protein n=1 Tax=Cohnella zeiphila TaxID=2761120 RepID=A0A7X0SJM4_9BACL|nr:hypothetical protein [Cohnella zeiphila]MBB6731179.1 hypothetical protein [Cohnella zeiphila]